MENSHPDISASTVFLAPLWRRSLASIINIVAVSGAVVVALSVVAAPLYVLGLYDEEAVERLRARVTTRRKKRSGRGVTVQAW